MMDHPLVYIVRTDLPINESLLTALSSDEQVRATEISRDNNKRRFVWTRYALRDVLGEVFGLEPSQVVLDTREDGSLSVANETVQISVSHTRGCSIVSVWRSRIGVDIEAIDRAPRHFEDIVEQRFPESEQREFQMIERENRFMYFLERWVEKEATLKAWRVGLAYGLYNVLVKDGKSVDAQGVHPTLQIFPLELPDGLMGCLASDTSVLPVVKKWLPKD